MILVSIIMILFYTIILLYCVYKYIIWCEIKYDELTTLNKNMPFYIINSPVIFDSVHKLEFLGEYYYQYYTI